MGCWETLLSSVGLQRPVYSEYRNVYVNHRPLRTGRPLAEEKYPNNRIVTSRYTLLTFPVQNLLEQFSRVANFYFLIVAVVQLVIDSPVSPVTSILPLVFVLSVTAVKQAYEDFLRHRADDRVNKAPVMAVRAGGLRTIRAEEISVGDVVCVYKNESFPCDLLLLSSSEASGECSITTANLDGETNLKVIYSVEATKGLQSASVIDQQLRAKVACEQPTPDLYKFKGTISVHREGRQDSKIPLSARNLLLRGAVLRNTERVFGAAVYTGQETKMQLNSQRGRSKKSVVEKRLDKYLLCFMVFLMLESAFCTTMKWVYAGADSTVANAWYLSTEEASVWRVVQDFLGFLVLFNYLIPISLYVTIELQKFIGSMFFEFDLEMYWEDPDTGERFRAKANTSDLNEELGQVQYLFSDKTGTLTENKMTFRQCCIGDRVYREAGGRLVRADDGAAASPLAPEEEKFLTVLALCHTVRVERPPDAARRPARDFSDEEAQLYAYQAGSPDEKAFVEACRSFGVVFHGTEDGVSLLTVAGRLRRFRVLDVLEFDSDRKRMSVVVQRQDGGYWLLTKGAESSMLDRCRAGDRDAIVRYSADFAVEGLRVLVIAERRLSEAEYRRLSQLLYEANQDVANREARTAEAYDIVERELTAVGCTAIEDELQVGVRETITDLRQAGIQVWILTGDKRETAENISLSAGHFTDSMSRVRIVEQETAAGCSALVRRSLEEIDAGMSREFCAVVDGQSLRHLVGDGEEELRRRFLSLCRRCSAVLCCRCTPLQKARVVSLVKNGVSPRPVTCAVGDGANDVSMIREAHVGIGLFGKEGRAAALNADYALGRFHFLRKAMLYHGHLYYVRICTLVQYFFYKNVAFITAELFYAFFSGFSAQSLYDSVYLTIYNITMTSLPVLLYGVFEHHVDRVRLYQEPEIYKELANNRRLWWSQLLLWCGLGLWHCACCHFGVAAALFVNDSGADGYSFDVFSFGAVVIECVLICVTLKLLLVSYSVQVPTVIGLAVTALGFVAVMSVYNVLQLPGISDHFYFLWVFFDIHRQPAVWLLLLSVPAAALTPDLLLKCFADTRTHRQQQRQQQLLASFTGDCSEPVPMETKNGGVYAHTLHYSVPGTKGVDNRGFVSA